MKSTLSSTLKKNKNNDNIRNSNSSSTVVSSSVYTEDSNHTAASDARRAQLRNEWKILLQKNLLHDERRKSRQNRLLIKQCRAFYTNNNAINKFK